MPAAMSLRTSVAVCGAMRLRQAAVPPIATSPSISTRSLIAIGMPCSGPTAWPARIALSTASAASRALAALTETKACSLGSRRSMRARYSSTRSTGYRRRAAISAASAWTEVMARSPADDSGNHAAQPSGKDREPGASARQGTLPRRGDPVRVGDPDCRALRLHMLQRLSQRP